MIKSFICHMPEVVKTPILFTSPHSGRVYERQFLAQTSLNWEEIRMSEDCFVDKLLDFANDCGSILIEATFPRAFVDLNRSSTELDPRIIKGIRNDFVSPRINAGLGVIPRVVGNGLEIYKTKISFEEASNRLNEYYFPFHNKLKEVISSNLRKFGFSILFDFHSMPHSSNYSDEKGSDSLPDIVLGDCFGASCHPWLIETAHDLFLMAGFKVELNNPFSGGFITQKYGSPAKNMHAIQVEIDRSLYMNEITLSPHNEYQEFKEKLKFVLSSLIDIKNIEENIGRQN